MVSYDVKGLEFPFVICFMQGCLTDVSYTHLADAIKVLEENGAGNISLLHCNTEYPTPYEDVNLLAMKQICLLYTSRCV